MKHLESRLPNTLDESELEDRFDAFLDDTNDEINIMGVRMTPHKFLYDNDHTAYRCEFCNWLDHEIGETLVEHDGEYYDKPEFYEAVAQAISAIEDEISEAQERFNDYETRRAEAQAEGAGTDALDEELGGLEQEIEELEAEKTKLEDL